MFSIDGLITGIDTTTIIDGLLSIQKSQVDRLTARKTSVLSEQSAMKGVEARILSLRSSLSRLTKSRESVFDVRSAQSGDEDILQATADSNAVPGVFSLRVEQLATAQQIASQSFADPDSQITSGTITLQVGSRPAVTIEINDQNNTVQGLADEINAATDDLHAAVINDGSSTRLLLNSAFTGTQNTINITNNLGPSGGGTVQPDFSGPPVQDAADAVIKFGSGAGAITVSSATNQVDNLISGVTLNLTAADAAQDVRITVTRETIDAEEAIRQFVDDYNSLTGYIDEQTRYIPESSVAGVLLGNPAVRQIQDQVRGLLSASVAGANPKLRQLSALGIQFDDRGQLFVNDAKLNRVLSGQENGVGIDDVKKLFALTGESNNQKIEFLLGSSRTVSGTQPIEVDITQAASQASVLGTNTIAASTVIDGTNNQLQVNIDGQASGPIVLTSGTYTQTELAALIEGTFNNNPAFNASVSVTVEGDHLRITSTSYGSNSKIEQLSGNALTALGFDGSETDTGTDVAGQFIVNGQIESATGKGRLLTGNSGNAVTADLQVRSLLKDADVQAGSEANLVITRGYAAELDQAFNKLLDPVNGRLKFANDGFTQDIESIESSIQKVNSLFESKQAYLLEQFSALESAVAQLQNTGNILAAQLGSLIGSK